ncbi:nucleotide pyrophosphohydrolase [Wenzhouxiangella limi]|uniref:Nucleotide pyrophosphohydrolase n=1 Tax=Wenzhouxiangella limi TaxID=2707351 RepID=A0A845V1R1_9GAMM|nr:nucleotide pyrophosphohydrolase [Wenzhouxiangella limi]NDY97038.1 nucleotide pyrophosphohydrolase [Wenzhouxiangella limi]
MPEWPELENFQSEFRAFVAERDWAQFHTPKNLAMALAGEVGELLEHFQWLTGEQSAELSPEQFEEVAHEIADVQIYLAALADRLGLEIGPAVARKMALNAAKYPADQARGSAAKYTAYQSVGSPTGESRPKKP